MSGWEEAATNMPTNQNTILSVDDLIMLVGEEVVRRRETEKRFQLFTQQISQQQAKLESQRKSEISKLDKQKQAEVEDITQEMNQTIKNLKERIHSLEEQVHMIALERDELKKCLKPKNTKHKRDK